jgi:hypothetical protein
MLISQIIDLLTSIDSRLDQLSNIELRPQDIESYLHEIKMVVSGFEHKGQKHPSVLEKIVDGIENIESDVSSMSMTLSSIDTNTMQ